MRPPGTNIPWEEAKVQIGGSRRETFLLKSADTLLARKFVDEYWHWSYSQKAAMFINYPPKVQGEPTGFTDDGRPSFTPTSPPAEIWFLPDVFFAEAWGFARLKGFANSGIAPAVVQACDAFVSELASRHPIGVEAVGEGWASFRRYGDGGALEIRDMLRAWELNIAVLGGRQDTLHMDRRIPRQFVRNGTFYFGL